MSSIAPMLSRASTRCVPSSTRAASRFSARPARSSMSRRTMMTERSNKPDTPSSGVTFGLTSTLALIAVSGAVFKYGESRRKATADGKHGHVNTKDKEGVPSAVAQKAVEAAESSSSSSSAAPQQQQQQPEQGGEQEQSQEAAFNPETGEINWDCPCLGGMAHGPCGEQFKAAFSCFVFSDVEPKGQDCIEHFRAMQECFKKHPEIYGDEDMGEEDEDSALVRAAEEALRD